MNMKKFFSIICWLLLCCCCIAACERNNINASEKIVDSITVSPEIIADIEDFENIFLDNPIDRDFSNSLAEGTDLQKAYLKLCKNWENELHESILHTKELVDSDTYDILVKTIEKWEENLYETYNFQKDLILNTGQIPYWEMTYAERADEYRQKTHWLKKLCFIIESERYYENSELISISVEFWTKV